MYFCNVCVKGWNGDYEAKDFSDKVACDCCGTMMESGFETVVLNQPKPLDIKQVSVYKTLRHIETVRNYLNTVIKELLTRGEQHDQSKLMNPEVEIFDEFTPKLRGITYGSAEYKECMKQMKPAIDHHNAHNRHHPEHHANGIKDMTLMDLVEMLCDWKAASLRHNDGNILKSIELNQKRFGYSGELRGILENTAKWLEAHQTFNHAEES